MPWLDLVFRQLSEPHDNIQYVVEVMGYATGEIAYGLHLLGVEQLFFQRKDLRKRRVRFRCTRSRLPADFARERC